MHAPHSTRPIFPAIKYNFCLKIQRKPNFFFFDNIINISETMKPLVLRHSVTVYTALILDFNFTFHNKMKSIFILLVVNVYDSHLIPFMIFLLLFAVVINYKK